MVHGVESNVCFVVVTEPDVGENKTDQWLGVSVSSQATNDGLAMVSLIRRYIKRSKKNFSKLILKTFKNLQTGGVSYSCFVVTIFPKHTVFALRAWDRQTDGRIAASLNALTLTPSLAGGGISICIC